MTRSMLRFLLVAGLLGLGACTSFEPRAGFPTADDMVALTAPDPYTRGKLHLEAGRAGLAVHQFRLALAREPGSIGTLNGLAVAHDQLGRPEQARAHLERALAGDERHVATLNNLGRWHLRHGEPATARAYLDRALAAEPGNRVVQANLRDLERRGAQVAAPEPAEPRAPMSLTPATEAQWQGYDAWVERTSRRVQTLVTRPDPAIVRMARETGIDPRLLSYTVVREPGPLPETLASAAVRADTRLPETLASAAVRAASGRCDLIGRTTTRELDMALAVGSATCLRLLALRAPATADPTA